MKKILSLTALVLALGAIPLLSQAADTTAPTPAGDATVRANDDGSHEVFFDGAAENADTGEPSGELDGYAGVVIGADNSATVYCDGDDSWDDPDGDDVDGVDPDGEEEERAACEPGLPEEEDDSEE